MGGGGRVGGVEQPGRTSRDCGFLCSHGQHRSQAVLRDAFDHCCRNCDENQAIFVVLLIAGAGRWWLNDQSANGVCVAYWTGTVLQETVGGSVKLILEKLGWLAQAPSSLPTRGEMIDRGRPWSTTVDMVGHGRSSSIMVDHSRTWSTIVDFG